MKLSHSLCFGQFSTPFQMPAFRRTLLLVLGNVTTGAVTLLPCPASPIFDVEFPHYLLQILGNVTIGVVTLLPCPASPIDLPLSAKIFLPYISIKFINNGLFSECELTGGRYIANIRSRFYRALKTNTMSATLMYYTLTKTGN